MACHRMMGMDMVSCVSCLLVVKFIWNLDIHKLFSLCGRHFFNHLVVNGNLLIPHTRKYAVVSSQQLLVVASFDDLAVAHDNDLVT